MPRAVEARRGHVAFDGPPTDDLLLSEPPGAAEVLRSGCKAKGLAGGTPGPEPRRGDDWTCARRGVTVMQDRSMSIGWAALGVTTDGAATAALDAAPLQSA